MTDTPQVLLAHHLKTLKLPVLREYDKLARSKPPRAPTMCEYRHDRVGTDR